MPAVDLTDWLGNSEERQDQIVAFPANALSATLNYDVKYLDGSVLPPLWHWLYFLPIYRLDQANYDGHAALGGFLPPVKLPRRMWAGSRVSFLYDLTIGTEARKVSTIKSIQQKSGKSGDLVFVTVAHQVFQNDTCCIEEEHDIVYRSAPDINATAPVFKTTDTSPEFSYVVKPDPILLFRYSALTFNGHRIHYDQPFCIETEGYEGLVVHGPLLATMMLDLIRQNFPDAVVKYFQFRALAPVFDTMKFEVCGCKISSSEVEIWIKRDDGVLAMSGSANLSRK
ncbi:MAG: acyl-CoA dehydrogenase [Paracoccaceae bacterium]|jgi:3-methylfumaryl-CoA hydratase